MGYKLRRHWRKSSQWFALTRKHAELVMQDTELLPIFQQHCQNAWDNDLNRQPLFTLPMMTICSTHLPRAVARLARRVACMKTWQTYKDPMEPADAAACCLEREIEPLTLIQVEGLLLR